MMSKGQAKGVRGLDKNVFMESDYKAWTHNGSNQKS